MAKKPVMLAACVLVALAVVSAVGIGWANQSGTPAGAAAESPALSVSLVKPAQRSWPETVPASGWLKPWQEGIVASEANGLRITDILVDVGSVVTKGQTLVTLSQDSLRADLRMKAADVETAKANLAKARADAGRARQLTPSGALSRKDADTYLTNEQTTRADLESAEAALDNAKIKLSQATITAADDGIITARSAELGAVVSPGTELFRLVRQSRVEWQAEVSSRYLPRISEGMHVDINGPDGHLIRAAVRLVAPSVATDTGRAIVYVALPSDLHPRTGLYLTGSVELQPTQALTVPDTAIVFLDGMNYVFTVDPERRVHRARVETGRRKNGEVEILSGLDSSARVVASGGAFLSDNDLVRVAGGS